MGRYLALAAVLLVTVLASAQVSPPPAPDAKTAAPQPEPKKSPEGKPKLPGDAIFILVEELKDSLALFPRFAIVRPDKLSELRERVSQLERQLSAEKKLPHACKMAGVVEGNAVQIRAEFIFETDDPRTKVLVCCKGAQIADANLKTGENDAMGRFPFLDSTNEGYEVHVPKAGQHHLTLQLRVPVALGGVVSPLGGGERSFELGLPGAAVSTLTLQLPEAVRELRWNKQVEKSQAAEKKQKDWELVLGKITNLAVSWREPISSAPAGPLLTAKGQLLVKVEDSVIHTIAELTLVDLRGQATEWRLWLPPKAKAKVTAPEGLRHKLTPAGNNTHLLKLDEPAAEPIKVQVTMEHPRSLARIPIGPYALIDAHRQDGTIEVRAPLSARRGVRLAYYFNDDIEEREIPKDANADTVALFRYRNLPTPTKPNPPATSKFPGTGAPLELELKTSKGRVETRVEHVVRVRPVEAHLQATVTTTILAEPLYAPVDFLDVQLPHPRWANLFLLSATTLHGFPDNAPWTGIALQSVAATEPEWVVSGGVPAELSFPDAAAKWQRRARIKLNGLHDKQFTVVLTAKYPLPTASQRVRLDLPRPVAILDRGGKVTIEVDEGRELLLPRGNVELPVPERSHHTALVEQAPAHVDFAWRDYRPEFPVHMVADVTLHDLHAHVQQQVLFPTLDKQNPQQPSAKARQLRLHVPSAIPKLKVSGTYRLVSHDRAGQSAWIAWLPDGNANAALLLEYDFVVPHRGEEARAAAKESGPEMRDFIVPLVSLAEATHHEAKVRLWGDPALQLADVPVDDLAWKDVGMEVVEKRDMLPLRVYQSDRIDVPLRIRLQATPSLLAAAVVDKVLLQVNVQEDGTEQYRARFRLSKIHTDHIEIRLPAPAAGLFLNITLDDKRIPWRTPESNGRVVRLSLDPSLYKQAVVLELTYQMARESDGLWQNLLEPPEFSSPVQLAGLVRWQIQLPGHWFPVLLSDDAAVEQQWGWRGWLPAPEAAASTAELESWFTERRSTDPARLPSVVCQQTSLGSVRLLRMPQQLWLLFCSGCLLLVGLSLHFAPVPTPMYWSVMTLLGLGLVASAVLWPSVLPAVLSGVLPGTVVLFLALGLQWLVQQRYRRQLVFMPGFTRAKPGSSLSRISSVRPAREPSTVDAPASTAAGVDTSGAAPASHAGS